MKLITIAYKESQETKDKMDALLPRQGMSGFIRKQTAKGLKNYENYNTRRIK